jgi:hypothetical protein
MLPVDAWGAARLLRLTKRGVRRCTEGSPPKGLDVSQRLVQGHSPKGTAHTLGADHIKLASWLLGELPPAR